MDALSVSPDAIPDVAVLEELLSRPSEGVVQALGKLGGDILVLGVGGKMGPTLARMAARAVTGGSQRVIGVSRFSNSVARQALEDAGVETIGGDLLDEGFVRSLPEVENIVFMAGTKFGAAEDPSTTWAMNTIVPALVAQRFRNSRIVVFSSGNVYPFVPSSSGGCSEETTPAPVGEYAQSVLGRERIFQFYGARHRTPVLLLRLNYAAEMRYGVLLDVAQKVWQGEPIDLSMGQVNVIWQGDANAYALQALALAEAPTVVLNITGPETISVRALALAFAQRLGRKPQLVGSEAPEALLNDASRAHARFGYPRVSLRTLIDWTADWVQRGEDTLGKPTKYQVRDGKF